MFFIMASKLGKSEGIQYKSDNREETIEGKNFIL